MAKDIEPFDIDSLERSLNDSAGRVSAVWISFLLFALYLAISAVTVSHRQLLLGEPVKLPVLNIDLPLLGFFIIAPALFFIFHVYVLLQIILLNRTAAAYNTALDGAVRSPANNATMRQRLANTLFAQIFAGSPRERGGTIGLALKLISSITLACAPVVVLFAFQVAFLPYHNAFATWTHRLLIALDLMMLILFWPMIVDASRDADIGGIFKQWSTYLAILLFALFSLAFVTYPNELQVRFIHGLKGRDPCDRGLLENIDRLKLSRLQLVDEDKLKKIVAAGVEKGLEPYQGERTVDLSGRNLECATMDGVDLRRADLRDSNLSGVDLSEAFLQGAELSRAVMLWQADLTRAKLDGASLLEANLSGAQLRLSSLRGGMLVSARMDAVSLSSADLQGADFGLARLAAADMSDAKLQAADLHSAFLAGADLSGARLDGAALSHLQAAKLDGAHLRGAKLRDSQLLGATFFDEDSRDSEQADLTDALIENPTLFNAGVAKCEVAFVASPNFDAVPIETETGEDGLATDDSDDKRIKQIVEEIPSNMKDVRTALEKALRQAVRARSKEEDDLSQRHWATCVGKDFPEGYSERVADYLIGMSCGKDVDSQYRIRGLTRIWVRGSLQYKKSPLRSIGKKLATAYLDEKSCPASAALSDVQKAYVLSVARAN